MRDLDETLPLFIEPIKDMLAGGARTNSKVAQYSHTQTMHDLSQFPGREGTFDCKLQWYHIILLVGSRTWGAFSKF